jgi:hypothetical protein
VPGGRFDSIVPGTDLGTLFSQFDLDQIIGSEIEADKVGRTREQSNQMVLAKLSFAKDTDMYGSGFICESYDP